MKTNKVKIIIVLLAAILVSIFNFTQKYSLIKFSYTLLIVLVIFYIIGAVVQNVVNNVINKDIYHDNGKDTSPVVNEEKNSTQLKEKSTHAEEKVPDEQAD